MPAPAIIHKLVETFEQNLEAYRSSKNETELRRQFLDPFFTALGWDVANEKGYDEAGKEVTHEFSVDVAGQQKKADYAFRVGRGERFDFLVEAKKPSVKIEASGDAAFQIRRYGWSAKLPVNILTDFEHFAVYDCRAKPNYSDKASMGRIMLIHYKEYAERWNEIAEIFSPEAVRKGSFAKYAEGMKGKKGTADVDDAFLQEIERWREALAKNIALRNDDIDVPGLNYAVQMTIDRIVFLRICEERGIEPENQLLEIATPLVPPIFAERGKISKTPNGENGGMSVGQGGGVYAELCNLFQRADTKYNSGLFHFKKEKDEPSRVDDLTLSLAIDDKVLKDIISNLYYPKSPYAFLYIPSDILGQVYERFLGKVIRLTAGHSAKVEEKPEVRKAGGVYYTPTYIVDYIVKNTVGRKLGIRNDELGIREQETEKAMTPTEVAKLKIVDPACGSGTFLLGAYQFLLDWHLEWYTNNDPEKWVKAKAISPISAPPDLRSLSPNSQNLGRDGEGLGGRVGPSYRLTTSKKKEILLNNIHGVDIDAQAVEVTKLSLLLKVLENASGQLGLGMERVLPDLGNNIKCGNSLIGFDYFEGQLFPDEEERARVNPFNWKREFPQVFAPLSRSTVTSPQIPKEIGGNEGGFDVVIGNPPYVRQESLSQFKGYFQKKFHSYDGVADLYIYFIEKGVSILQENGVYSIIVSSSFLRATYGKALRTYLAQNSKIIRIVDFGGLAIFENAKDTYVCIPLLSRATPAEQIEICKVPSVEDIDLSHYVLENSYHIPSTQLTTEAWSIDNTARLELFQKIMTTGVSLGEYTQERIFYGVKTGLNEAFVIDTPTKEKLISQHAKSAEIIKPLLQGEDIREWHINNKNRWLIFTRRGINIDEYPAIKAHLTQWKEDLTPKQDKNQKRGRKPGRYKWYEIQDDVAYYQVFDGAKIIFPDIAKNPRFYFDKEGFYLANTAYAIGTEDRYLLGILNSKLFWFAISNISIPFGIRAGEYRYRLIYQYMEKVPIRAINFSDPAEKAAHDKMVSLVEQMLALHKEVGRIGNLKGPHVQERLERQIQNTDASIDSLVYELYGLSEEEIKIVEG